MIKIFYSKTRHKDKRRKTYINDKIDDTFVSHTEWLSIESNVLTTNMMWPIIDVSVIYGTDEW